VISVPSIKRAVAEAHGIPVDELSGPGRLRMLVYPRQEAMFLCRKLIRVGCKGSRRPIPLVSIGRRFGSRHHTTVLSALEAVEKRRASDPRLRMRMRSMAIDARRSAA
jgi:chromosomal replication initiator protein